MDMIATNSSNNQRPPSAYADDVDLLKLVVATMSARAVATEAQGTRGVEGRGRPSNVMSLPGGVRMLQRRLRHRRR